jgi:hypothetical protein
MRRAIPRLWESGRIATRPTVAGSEKKRPLRAQRGAARGEDPACTSRLHPARSRLAASAAAPSVPGISSRADFDPSAQPSLTSTCAAQPTDDRAACARSQLRQNVSSMRL